jgi:uncharacterized protein
MLYAIIAQDTPDGLQRRLAARTDHLNRVQELRAAGRLVIAGPFPALDSRDPGPAGYTGSLIVAEFACLEDARSWADADPYLAARAWASVDVRPFVQVQP